MTDGMNAATFRALRTYLGFSVAQIADYLDVSQNSARNWDKGAYNPPVGVADELHELMTMTSRAVDYLVQHYSQSDIEWPMLIPRTPEQLEDFAEVFGGIPDGVTVDWWKMVGVRVCEQVPGLTIGWA